MYKHGNASEYFNGILSPDQDRRLHQHRPRLTQNLRAEPVVDSLTKEGVLNVFDTHKIHHSALGREQNAIFLDIMATKSPKAFQVLLDALRDSGQTWAYDLLCPTSDTDRSTADIAVQATAPEETESQPLSTPVADQEGQRDQSTKMLHLEDRVDKLADSVDSLKTQVLETNRRTVEAERLRETQLKQMEKQLQDKDEQLVNAHKQIDELRAKIVQVEEQKQRESKEANITISKMNDLIQDLTVQKESLEQKVQNLREENVKLRSDIDQIQAEKTAVQKVLKRQSEEMKTITSRNKLLEDKVQQQEQVLQVVVNKVDTLVMSAGALRSSRSRKAIKSSAKARSKHPPAPFIPALTASPAANISTGSSGKQASPRPPSKAGKEPSKQALAKPNSRKQ